MTKLEAEKRITFDEHLFKMLKLGHFRLSPQNFGLLLALATRAQSLGKSKFSLPVADIAVDARISQQAVEWGLGTLKNFGFLEYSTSGSRVTIYFGGGHE